MKDLEPNSKDHLVSAAKGVVGACPVIGPLAAETIGTLIPNQRLDRVVEFLRHLEAVVHNLDGRLEHFERSLREEEGISIFEEGLVQAARSFSKERKERLAHLVANSLTKEEVRYEESRKILNLFCDLTDPELLWLIYFSLNPVLAPGPHRDLIEKHPDVLEPIGTEFGSPQEQIDRAALQDSYKNTLLRFGLIEEREGTRQITALGSLLVRYIHDE